jgi:TonB family protein
MVERLDASKGRLGESKSIALSGGPIPVEMDRTPSAAAATIPTREILAVEEPSLFSTTEEIDDEEAPLLFSRSFANIEETPATRFWVMLSVVVVLAGIVASALWVRGHKNEAPPAATSQNAPAVSEPAQQEPSTTPAPPTAKPTESEPSPPRSKAETDETPPAETQAAPSANQPVPQLPPAADHAPAKENSEGLVAKRVLPTVSPGARRGMRRPLEVIVRVTVNQEGAVSNAAFVSPGSGNYFARLAQKAALSWEFTPPRRNGNPVRSVWTLRFHFEREKTEVMAVEESR